MQGKAEEKSGAGWWGVVLQPVLPEQCLNHEARSQASCVIKELSSLQLAPCSVLGTENRERRVSTITVVTVALETRKFAQIIIIQGSVCSN